MAAERNNMTQKKPTETRKRNTQGVQTEAVSITLPTDLHQTINGIVVTSEKSRSLVITELILEGLAARERKRVTHDNV